MTTRFTLKRVLYMPKQLEPSILYVAEEFDIAGHLCACGCGSKVMTPLGPAEWSFEDSREGPTLRPSVGSWQLPCKSHYLITRGEVRWAEPWTSAQIERGRRVEEGRRRDYYESRRTTRRGRLAAAWCWFKSRFPWSR